ncbi:MAG: carboxylating nicotinate-nucleotide diphosphorylase [bacterium]|nr:carboxylating nicotinate-nucleotide diphosphorylase [bacterium]
MKTGIFNGSKITTFVQLNPFFVHNHLYKKIVENALLEDLGMGDITTNSIFDSSQIAKGSFRAKAPGVIAGLEVLNTVYSFFDSDVRIDFSVNDGGLVTNQQIIAEVEGPVTTLLSGERVVLNILQHMSGIATSTRELVRLLNDPTIAVVDTRKTLPGLCGLQKYAVTCGGGKNHRFRLDDGAMIKDNHIKAAGSITKAIQQIRAKAGHMVSIEVETENKAQVLEAIEAGADVIMLDNRSPEEVREFVKIIPDHITVEISGGINPSNIASYKGCGADIISVGWITHSVKALDISFNLSTS